MSSSTPQRGRPAKNDYSTLLPALFARWQEGETLAALVQTLGISPSRLGQLFVKHGYSHPPILTAPEAAEYCHVTRQRIYDAVAKGQLEVVPGSVYRFTRSALNHWQKRKWRHGVSNSAIILPCTNCGTSVKTWPSQVTTETGNKFCNRACYLAWRHGKQDISSETHARQTGI
jgi:excisionase family DNA binding protein